MENFDSFYHNDTESSRPLKYTGRMVRSLMGAYIGTEVGRQAMSQLSVDGVVLSDYLSTPGQVLTTVAVAVTMFGLRELREHQEQIAQTEPGEQ